MPERAGWTGTQVAVLVILLVVTNAVTASVMFFAFPAAPGQAALTIYHPWSGSERDLFLPVLDAFTEETGILVEDRTFRQEELQTLLPTQFSASQTPADVIFMASAFIRDWGEEGWAMDMSGSIDEADYLDGVFDPVKGATLQEPIPIYGGAYSFKVKPGFWYKDSFFTANGYDKTPANFAAFQALLAEILGDGTVPIVSGNGVGWPLSDAVEHFIASYGGADMHRGLTDGSISWTSTAVRDVFADNLVPLLEAGYFDTPVEWTAGVADLDAENNALYFQGSWLPTMSQTSDEDDMRAMPLPGGVQESAKGVVAAVDYLFVPTFTSQPAAAQQLFDYLVSADGQTVQIAQGGHFATHRSADLTQAPPTYDPESLIGARQLLPDLDDTIGGTFQTTFWAQLQALWANPGTLDTVLANIQAAA